jgi:hypothetical protein
MKSSVQKQIKKALGKNTACYVLIKCDEPTEDGNMQVEMTYEGDANVASCLLRGAQSFMDEQEECRSNCSSSEDKILSIDTRAI